MKIETKLAFRKSRGDNHFWFILGGGYGHKCFIIWLLFLEIQINFNK
jgi:hypothetical protein